MRALETLKSRAVHPSEEQCNLLHRIAVFADAVVAGEDPSPPLIFLEGPGGTGKSFLFECVENILAAVARRGYLQLLLA
jgi:pantothenate kinase-related protein Tda10